MNTDSPVTTGTTRGSSSSITGSSPDVSKGIGMNEMKLISASRLGLLICNCIDMNKPNLLLISFGRNRWAIVIPKRLIRKRDKYILFTI